MPFVFYTSEEYTVMQERNIYALCHRVTAAAAVKATKWKLSNGFLVRIRIRTDVSWFQLICWTFSLIDRFQFIGGSLASHILILESFCSCRIELLFVLRFAIAVTHLKFAFTQNRLSLLHFRFVRLARLAIIDKLIVDPGNWHSDSFFS